jgi:copper transport protein
MLTTVPSGGGNQDRPPADCIGIMTVMDSRARIVWSTIAGALVGLFLVVGGPATPAAAHANLVGSDPAEGSLLNDPPTQVVLTFSEPVRLVPDRIVVVGPDGEQLALGEPSVDGTELTIPMPEVFDIGTYLVSYRVVSQDNHPVGGAVTYSLGAPSEVPELPAGGTSEAGDPTVRVAVSVNKYLSYAGLVLLVGPALMLALLWPRRVSRRGAARLLWTGLGLVAVSTLVGVWLQAPYSTGERLFGATAADLREVVGSSYGTAHIVRLGVLVAVALLLRPLLAGRADRWDLLLLAGLGVVGLGTWPVAGHPVASPVPVVSIVADTVHIGAAAVWVGGLVVLAGFLLRLANEHELGAILPEWSRWAALAVSVLLLAGLLQAVVEIGPLDALVTTSYGRLLLVKVGLVAVVIAVASYSRRLVRMRLGASRPGAMRAAVAAEAVLLAGVLVMSSMLVQTTPGRTEAAAPPEQVAAGYFSTTVDSELYQLEVQVEPTEVGSNTFHLYAYTPDGGEPQLVEEWRATAALPPAGIEPIEVPLLPLTDNHAFGEAALSVAGDWVLRLTVRVSEIDQASVEVTVPIR